MKNVISTDKAPKAIGPYSQAIMVNNVIYTSGQLPMDPETGNIEAKGIKAQAEQALKNLQAVLEAAGATFDNVVKTTCFLAEISDFAAFNEVYAEYIKSAPARSCFAVKDLPKGALIEIEAVAYLA
ncbi:MAG: RidA family protein [Clostridia bacterium]|nr:RidA family protein [Oscillospiraceae bacterium]MBQ6701867.1 RidA family protein [Clostridia bacterium]